MEQMTSKIESYKCNWCGKLHPDEVMADRCALDHAKEKAARSMLEYGYGLSSINYVCGFNWDLKGRQAEITKDSCFTIYAWQSCDKPAYQIVDINTDGALKLAGVGCWSGPAQQWVRIHDLPEHHEKEELYVHPGYNTKRRPCL